MRPTSHKVVSVCSRHTCSTLPAASARPVTFAYIGHFLKYAIRLSERSNGLLEADSTIQLLYQKCV